jgi:hypothetical protein
MLLCMCLESVRLLYVTQKVVFMKITSGHGVFFLLVYEVGVDSRSS